MLELGGASGVAAQRGFQRGAGRAAAVLGLHRQRPTQGVEAKQRIRAGHQGHRRNRAARNQVPAHHVAEGLVHAHAVHVHRQALRRAQQRRGGVAPVAHIHLKRIALRFVDMHAAEAAVHELAQLQRAAARDVGAGGALHRRGDFVARLADAGQRCAADDFDGGQRFVLLRVRLRAESGDQRQQQRRLRPGQRPALKRGMRHSVSCFEQRIVFCSLWEQYLHHRMAECARDFQWLTMKSGPRRGPWGLCRFATAFMNATARMLRWAGVASCVQSWFSRGRRTGNLCLTRHSPLACPRPGGGTPGAQASSGAACMASACSTSISTWPFQ